MGAVLGIICAVVVAVVVCMANWNQPSCQYRTYAGDTVKICTDPNTGQAMVENP